MVGAADWIAAPSRSTLRFSAVQQSATFEGAFTRFSTRVTWDPLKPTASKISAVIETGSVNTQNEERDGYLRDSDWFEVSQWPSANFQSTAIKAAGPGSYVASGTLKIRDQSRPVALNFKLLTARDGSARLTGTVNLRRLDFGIGRGVWSNTDWVGDNVKIVVDLALQPVKP